MFLTTANVQNLPDLSRPHVRADMRRVKALGRTRPNRVVLWQEIAEYDDRQDLREVFPTWTHLHMDTECPISLSPHLRAQAVGALRLHGGRAHVSPARVLTWALVQHTGRYAYLPDVVLTNTHYVSGHETHPDQAAEAWRDAMWAHAHAVQTDFVRRWNSQGVTVVGGGDYNDVGHMPSFTAGTRWVARHGYDRLHVDEAREGAQVGKARARITRGLHSDHAAVSAVLPLAVS